MLTRRDKTAIYLGLEAGDLVPIFDQLENENDPGASDPSGRLSGVRHSENQLSNFVAWFAASTKLRGHNPALWVITAILMVEGIKYLSPGFFSPGFWGLLLVLYVFGLSFFDKHIDAYQVKMATTAISGIENLNLSPGAETDLIKRKGQSYSLNRKVAFVVLSFWILTMFYPSLAAFLET